MHEEDKKILKLIHDYASKIIIVLPIFLIIGILYQFINLIIIDKLVFFSWTQVINDSVSLFFPFVIWFLWIIFWSTIKINNKKWFTSDFIVYSFIAAIIFAIFYWFKLPLIYKTFWVWFLFMFLWKSFIASQILTGSEKLKSEKYRLILNISYIIISIIWIFTLIADLQYKNLYIKIDNIKENIIYINDNYIITKDKIVHNRDDLIFHYLEDNKNIEEVIIDKEDKNIVVDDWNKWKTNNNEKKLETLEKSNEEENIKNILEKNNFNIIEVLDDSCIADIDCKTPAHYMIQSHCPYNSKCIKSKCSVICPSSFTGKIIDSNIIPMLD